VRRVRAGWDGTEDQPLQLVVQLVVDLGLDVFLAEETRGWRWKDDDAVIDVVGL
jgi:hypothetical protein